MIPVKPRLAPRGFNKKVLRPGREWIREKGFPSRGPVPKDKDGKPIELNPFWRRCLAELYERYEGICAYVAIVIPRVTGTPTTDHFIAKSSAIELAYRWKNFRLASAKINSRKGTFDDILDPFTIDQDTYQLNLLTGAIVAHPALAQEMKTKAELTINRLGLDDPDCRNVRSAFFDEYCKRNISFAHLKKIALLCGMNFKGRGFDATTIRLDDNDPPNKDLENFDAHYYVGFASPLLPTAMTLALWEE